MSCIQTTENLDLEYVAIAVSACEQLQNYYHHIDFQR